MIPSHLSALLSTPNPPRLIDVRTPREFESAHIDGSLNLPLDQLSQGLNNLPTETLILICQSGQRAKRASEILSQSGLTNLQVLQGGIENWIAANNPIIRGRPSLSLERQVRIIAGALAATGGILNINFAFLSVIIGLGLVFAGISGFCGMAVVLSKLPYNKNATRSTD